MVIETISAASKPATVNHEALINDLDNFNREAVAIATLVEEIRPESEAFFQAGERLQAVLDAGIENLSPQDLQRFHVHLGKMHEWMARFQPRYDAIQARVAAQGKREIELRRKARAIGINVDFHSPSPLGAN
jgi:hypothetical protein